MFKLIRRLILLAFILVVGFLALAITGGGEKFRWLGSAVKDKSAQVGETADLIKKASDDIKNATRTIKQTGQKIGEIATDTKEAASAVINATGKVVKQAGELADKAANAVKNTTDTLTGTTAEGPEKTGKKRAAGKDIAEK